MGLTLLAGEKARQLTGLACLVDKVNDEGFEP